MKPTITVDPAPGGFTVTACGDYGQPLLVETFTDEAQAEARGWELRRTPPCTRCGNTGLVRPTETDLGFCGCPVGRATFDTALAIALETVGGV